MWKPLKFGVWFGNFVPPALHWWPGWSNVGNKQQHPLGSREHTELQVRRQVHDGWTDFFLGAATTEKRCHHLLDASVKVGLHYCCSDLWTIGQMACPSNEIPTYLWQQLQWQRNYIAKRRFKHSYFSIK